MADDFARVCADLLLRGCRVRFRAEGHSMAPTIHPGETVLVEPLGTARPRRGDIVLYRWGSGVRAHRVVRAEGATSGTLLVQGDALDTPDAPVPTEAVLGLVRAVERRERLVPLTGRVALRRQLLRIRLSRLRRRWQR